VLDESLLQPAKGEIVSDLIVAAHADAKRKLDETQARLMQEAAGPLAGLAGRHAGLSGHEVLEGWRPRPDPKSNG
jgi:hypothetical protein